MSEPNHGELPELDRLRDALRASRQTIGRLRDRVERLERTVDLVSDDPQMKWLYRNREERMDAFVPIFAPLRAAFHLARYEFAARYSPGKVAADIACGTGYGCRVLAERGRAASVTGIDVSREAIEYACSRHAADNVRYQVADAADTGLDATSVELVTSFETIEHLADDVALIDEFHRILVAGGLLICSTPNGWPLEIARHHVREYDRQSFVEMLERRFVIEEMFSQNSGSDFRYNYGQPAGIIPTTRENEATAECFIAVARRRPSSPDSASA